MEKIIVITISLIVIGAMVPLFMIIFGRKLLKTAPKNVNYVVGYRTKRSMASQETWHYANTVAGKYWIISGRCCLPVFIILCAALSAFYHVANIDESYLIYFFFGILLLQMIPLFSVIPYTERKLKAKFRSS